MQIELLENLGSNDIMVRGNLHLQSMQPSTTENLPLTSCALPNE